MPVSLNPGHGPEVLRQKRIVPSPLLPQFSGKVETSAPSHFVILAENRIFFSLTYEMLGSLPCLSMTGYTEMRPLRKSLSLSFRIKM